MDRDRDKNTDTDTDKQTDTWIVRHRVGQGRAGRLAVFPLFRSEK